VLQLRADFRWDHGDLEGSRRDYLESVRIGAALMKARPDDREIIDKHASSLNNLSILFCETGEQAERIGALEKSTALRERLVGITPADDPRREQYVSNLGSCYGNLGTLHLERGQLDQAIMWTEKALAIQDKQIKEHPNSVNYLERVGANHMVLGQLSIHIGELARARSELETGLSFLEHLKRIRPGDVTHQAHLMHCLGLLADVATLEMRSEPASLFARRARLEAEEILQTNPKYHPASHGVAQQLLRQAEFAWDAGELASGLAEIDRAEQILRTLVASYPEPPRYRAELAGAIRARVRFEEKLGRRSDVERRLREAASIAESVRHDDPDQIESLTGAAAVFYALAAALKPGDAKESQSLFGRARDLLEEARRRSPTDQHIRRTLAEALVSHAAFLARTGKPRESMAALDLIPRAGLVYTPRDRRELGRALSAAEFDRLRDQPALKLLMMDLAFPSEPFAELP
jgi:tetratricopeptide (TPR) repeat protein